MRIGLGKAVLAALSALGIMLGAGGAAAIPLQVTGDDVVFSSGVSLGGTDLSNVSFSFTGLIDSAADRERTNGLGLFTLGATTFTLASGESFTALAGQLQLALQGFGPDTQFEFQDTNDSLGGGFAAFSVFPVPFDVDAPTPGALSDLRFGPEFGGGGTIDFGPDGILPYARGLFSFGPDATVTFAAPAVAVPEPATLALLGLGLAGLGFALRRRSGTTNTNTNTSFTIGQKGRASCALAWGR